MLGNIKKLLTGIILLVICLVLASPFLLYVLGMFLIEGKPQPTKILSSYEQQEIWYHIERTNKPHEIVKLNPWKMTINLIGGQATAGTRPAALVARNYIRTKIKDKRMIYWHLAYASMTIWVSRNWSKEEILSALYMLYSHELDSSDLN